MTARRPMPTQDDVLGYFDTLSNWGRWGDDDELGTLHHITTTCAMCGGWNGGRVCSPTISWRPSVAWG